MQPIASSRQAVPSALTLLLCWIAVIGVFVLVAMPAEAAGRTPRSVLPPGASAEIQLYPGIAPGSENWTWHEVTDPSLGGGEGDPIVRDVVKPTLLVFQPPNPKRAAHTAVIIAPGGAFLWLSIESEGYDVARALAAKGITAIVLKYRLLHTPENEQTFLKGIRQDLSTIMPRLQHHNPQLSPRNSPAVADGIAAVRYVREHAAELLVNPDRIGMLGFSAGGVVTMGTILYGGAQSRLAFAGLIYGAFRGEPRWPAATPPIFLAVASDDPTGAAGGSLSAFDTLRAQHHPAELHVFQTGGHGFGAEPHGLTTDLWLGEFVTWASADGFLSD